MKRPGLALSSALLAATSGAGGGSAVAADRVSARVESAAAESPRVARAVATFQEYLGHVRKEDEAAAAALWHPEDIQPVRDWSLGYLTWGGAFLASYRDSVIQARDGGDHVRLRVLFQPLREQAAPSAYDWYFVEEGDRTLAVSALHLFTRGWERDSLGILVLHWPPGRTVDREEAARTERVVSAAARTLGVAGAGPVHMYLCAEDTDVGRLFAGRAAPARAHLRNAVVAAVHEHSAHEALHVLLHRLHPGDTRGHAVQPWAEGIAYCLGGGNAVSREFLLSRAAQIRRAGENQALGELMARVSGDDRAPEAAELAGIMQYLLEIGGGEALATLQRVAHSRFAIAQTIEEVYGESWHALDRQVGPWLQEHYDSPVRGGRLEGARTVQRLEDARGDGLPGMDLLTFSMTATEDRVGFEIEVDSLLADGGAFGFGGPYSRITLRSGAADSARVRRILEVSPDGVLVATAAGQWLDALRVPREGELLVQDGVIAFSIPVSLAGAPVEDLRCEVDVGPHAPSPDFRGGVGVLRGRDTDTAP